MANAATKARTNYVEITDFYKFRDILSRCIVDDGETIHIMTHECDDGKTKYGFYCEANICGMRAPDEECSVKSCETCDNYYECEVDCDYDAFLKELQQVIAPGDALIVTTLCYEKIKYLQSYAEIITAKSITYLTLSSLALAKAREELGNKNWITVNDC